MKKGNYRPTWAEIDLKAVGHNLNRIRKLVDKNVGIMTVVKANAYGHGICRISKVLVKSGINYLGVATVDEALKLRDAGIKVPVLVMGSVLKDEAEAAIKRGITLTLCDRRLLRDISAIAVKTKRRPRVHVKIDTGMGRIGVWHEEAFEFIKSVYKDKNMELEGVYTHFSSAGRDKSFTRSQIKYFENLLSRLEKENIPVKYKHAANSIAACNWKRAHMNLVRPGILVYGIYPKESFRRRFKLKPVMKLKTRIVYLKNTPAGRSISYGRTYVTKKPTKIATIPIGYADGYGRILSNKAKALVKGKFARVVGIVTMDQALLDVGHIKNVKIGDEAVLIGSQGNAKIPVEKVAKLAGTIPYEIVSGITDRVPRIYT